MPPRRNKEKFQQLTEFERGKITSLREGRFSFRAIEARVQRNSSPVMRVWKQWTDEHRTTRKTGSGRRKRNHASICGTMMAAFVLEAMPVNAAFQSALSNDTVAMDMNISNDIVTELWFGKDKARPHVAKTVRDFWSAQYMQLLPWPVYSPDMSPIEHVWDLVGRRIARDSRLAASKDELLLRIQAIRNPLPQADIQNLFDSISRRIAAFIAARGGYTKY
ncbi:hypothetical protein TNCV_2134991 [Trichonephila clavipes]|nr:hypothetical protein TNCV_2134991 [Trichonephila clavipes]